MDSSTMPGMGSSVTTTTISTWVHGQLLTAWIQTIATKSVNGLPTQSKVMVTQSVIDSKILSVLSLWISTHLLDHSTGLKTRYGCLIIPTQQLG